MVYYKQQEEADKDDRESGSSMRRTNFINFLTLVRLSRDI